MPFLDLSFTIAPEDEARIAEFAGRLGLSPDQMAARDEARNRDSVLFEDIAAVLGPRARVGRYLNPNGVELAARAYANPDHAIVQDVALSTYLIRLSFFATATACLEAPPEATMRLLMQECDVLRRIQQTGVYSSDGRHAFLQMAMAHPDLWSLTVAQSRAFLAFVLCHEIAHHRLRHFDKAPSLRQECTADRLAAAYMARLVRGSGGTVELRLTPILLSAPLVLFRTLAFLADGGPNAERLRQLTPRLGPHLGPEAERLWGAVQDTLDYFEHEGVRSLADWDALSL